MTNTRSYQITAELLSTLRAEGFVLGIGKHLQIQTLLQKLPADTSDDALKLALIPLLAQSPSEQERLYGIFEDCVKRVNDTELTEEDKQELQKGDEKAQTQSKLRRIVIPLVLALILALGGYFLYKKLNPPVVIPQPKVEINSNVNPNDTLKTQNPKLETSTSYFVDNKPYPFPNHLEEYDIEVSPTQQWLSDNWAWLRWVLAVALTGLLLALWRYWVWKRRKLVAEQDPNDKPPYFWNVHIESVNDFLEHDGFDNVSQLLRKRADTDTLRLDMPRTIQATVEKGGMPEFRFKKQTTPSEYLLLIDRQSVRNHRAQLFDKLYEAFKAQEIEIHRYFYDSDMRMCFDEAHSYGISIADVQQRHYQSRLIVVGTGAQMLAPLSGKLAAWTSIFAQWKDRALLTPKPLKAWGYDERQLASVFTTLPSTLQGLGFWVEELDMGNDARFETWREKIHDAPNAPIQPDELDPMPLLSLYYDIPMLKWICACAIYPTLHWDLTLWLGSRVEVWGLKVQSNPQSSTPNPSTTSLSNFDNLSQLTRLSWFVSGEMPNETRVALINWLEEHDPELLQHMRLAITLELQKNPPPKDSVAFEPFRMSVAVNEWLATDDAARKKELEEEIKQLLEKGIDPDFTVIKYLTKPRTKLEFYMPDSWRKYVYPKGFSALGWLKEVKDLRWLIPLWILGLVALFYPYNFKTNNCSKDKIVSIETIENVHLKPETNSRNLLKDYNVFTRTDTGVTRQITRYFCLDNPYSYLAYFEHTLRTDIFKNRTSYITDLVPKDSPIVVGLNRYLIQDTSNMNRILGENQLKDSVIHRLLNECNRNFAVDFYRLAKKFYEKRQNDSTCFYLNIASKFDSLDGDIKVAKLLCNKPKILEKNLYIYNIAPNIEGSVIDSSTKKPIENVQIKGTLVNTTTNTQGRYTLNLPPQYPSPTIVLTFTKKDYNTIALTLTIDKMKQLPKVSLKSIENVFEPSKPLVDKPVKKTEPLRVSDSFVDDFPDFTKVGILPNSIKRDIIIRQQPSTFNPKSTTLVIVPATILVKGGTFTMGCTKEQSDDCEKDESPAHQVTLGDFKIGQFEVTTEQFIQFLNEKGNQEEGGTEWIELDEGDLKGNFTVINGREKLPIRNVTWYGASAYCNWLSEKTGKKYRLPTEAEWEYAARGGNQSRNYKYSGSNTLDEVAWYASNSNQKTHPVGTTKKANELGIYDMSGNVWEWCSDNYNENFYKNSSITNPQGADRSDTRSLRGGSWDYNYKYCRVSARVSDAPDSRNSYVGFRIVWVSQDK